MSYLIRTGTGRNNISWSTTANSSTKYLRRLGSGRNNVAWTTIPNGSTYNILQRNGTGRNNVLYSNLNIPDPYAPTLTSDIPGNDYVNNQTNYVSARLQISSDLNSYYLGYFKAVNSKGGNTASMNPKKMAYSTSGLVYERDYEMQFTIIGARGEQRWSISNIQQYAKKVTVYLNSSTYAVINFNGWSHVLDDPFSGSRSLQVETVAHKNITSNFKSSVQNNERNESIFYQVIFSTK